MFLQYVRAHSMRLLLLYLIKCAATSLLPPLSPVYILRPVASCSVSAALRTRKQTPASTSAITDVAPETVRKNINCAFLMHETNSVRQRGRFPIVTRDVDAYFHFHVSTTNNTCSGCMYL